MQPNLDSTILIYAYKILIQ